MYAYGQAVEQQRENTLDITSDLSRQYKAMQEQSLRRIDELELRNNSLEEQLGQKQSTIEQMQQERVHILEERNKTVNELQLKVSRCRRRCRPVSDHVYAPATPSLKPFFPPIYFRVPSLYLVPSLTNRWTQWPRTLSKC